MRPRLWLIISVLAVVLGNLQCAREESKKAPPEVERIAVELARRAREAIKETDGAGIEAAGRMSAAAGSIRESGFEPWRKRIELFYFWSRTNQRTPAGMGEYVLYFFAGEECDITALEFVDEKGQPLAKLELPGVLKLAIGPGLYDGIIVCYVNWDGKSKEQIDGARIVSLPRQNGIKARLIGDRCASNEVEVKPTAR